MSAPRMAAVVERFGGAGALRVRETAPPRPGRGQVVVRVAAASINPIDVRRRAGYGRKLFGLMGAARLPLVLGNDFAGTVCAVGPGVTAWREGDAVFGAKPPSRHGSHASHVTVDARHVLAQPARVTPVQLATLPYNFLTVCRALDGAGLTRASAPGRQVLVHGGSGGLGMIAIALLKQLGAHVTTTAGEHGLAACRAAGADLVLDRRLLPLEALPRRFAATLNFAHWHDDAALVARLAPDALGHATTVHPLLAQIDRYGLAGGALAALAGKRRGAAGVPRGARYAWTVFRPDDGALDWLAEYAVARKVAPTLQAFRMGEVAAAHVHVEERRLGRAVLLPNNF
ncbi:alcohol dehydrogenase catalytic domain-containing protein [Rugamonas sp. A1-17]|nr:alcohol dehydrogenase catalytic domain-containing protein [Rugamonas sp. A1-17]